ncbi:DUF6710 family protein [Sutcliffiella horikoshii]|uniref:DUF6710 family protein n=1 Tax=Sutcliffiella horikoshii TaxID=79883 RepID=UPI001F237FAA|nr:DUF6710 family protein [Sutcliffiella horikoshii]MCG1020778.1 hypothetical protein [Sutcliffiella horikoshii]
MFFKTKVKSKKISDKQQEEFQNILSFAKTIIETSQERNPGKHPIHEVIHILGNKIRSDYMVRLLKVKDESDLSSFVPPKMFESNQIFSLEGEKFYDLITKKKETRYASLNKDTVIPWAWKRERLSNVLLNIGPDRPYGDWKQDKLNHKLQLWLPLGLYWVWGGNHSISVGILQGKGTISTSDIYDISNIYNYVTCDGRHYIRKFDQ